jgi:cell filamentation protein, protein adenylyltransferase
METIQYSLPEHWIKYDKEAISNELTNAKAEVLALKAIPFQRRWVQEIQQIQLKMEVAGTSRIEGADFAANELDVAMTAASAAELLTRSQKQANAAVRAYKTIAGMPDDCPIDENLISQIHRIIVTDCDDDRCPPGIIRRDGQNVTFGVPKHRGCPGGIECTDAIGKLSQECKTSYREHDQLIQALALHYHLAAIHPFLDGNGRTARVLEALILQRAGLKDCLFIAVSNFYYEEKPSYLAAMAEVRAKDHDLTPFLKFGLKGIALQTERLTKLIRNQVSKEIFRNLMHDLFTRLQSTRKRVIVRRQLTLLEKLLNVEGEIEFGDLASSLRGDYGTRKHPLQALIRDIGKLINLGALNFRVEKDKKNPKLFVSVKLDWPATITETEFFERLARLPKSKTYAFLSSP